MTLDGAAPHMPFAVDRRAAAGGEASRGRHRQTSECERPAQIRRGLSEHVGGEVGNQVNTLFCCEPRRPPGKPHCRDRALTDIFRRIDYHLLDLFYSQMIVINACLVIATTGPLDRL